MIKDVVKKEKEVVWTLLGENAGKKQRVTTTTKINKIIEAGIKNLKIVRIGQGFSDFYSQCTGTYRP